MSKQSKVLLMSVDAKHFHKPLAVWQLKAFVDNKGKGENFLVEVLETNINEPIDEIVRRICFSGAEVVGFSCYIWNIEVVRKIGELVKKLLPNAKIILGGPEVSFEKDLSNFKFADCIIRGAGEIAFFDILQKIKNGERLPAIIQGEEFKPPRPLVHPSKGGEFYDGTNCGFAEFPTPITSHYLNSFKTDKLPIDKKLVYYQSVRGCPFNCAFCLSSASAGILELPLDRVKSELLQLVEAGVKVIKFVDRTFNANKNRAIELLQFIGTLDTDCVFHFEMSPDLFSEDLFKAIKKLPKARVQFELGIQSTNPDTLKAVERKTDTKKALKNIEKLVGFNNCHIHISIVAGLPFETLNTFKDAVNACIATKAQAVQLGFLKLLKGAKINDLKFGAVFASFPPYEAYKTDTINLDDFAILKRVEKAIDRFYNSGGFSETISYAIQKLFTGAFDFFNSFALFLEQKGLAFNMSLNCAYSVLREFLIKLGGNTLEIDHYIKLDCYSFDRGGLSLPNSIKRNPDKALEKTLKQNYSKNTPITVEAFLFDNTKRLFIYDKKDKIINKFTHKPT